MATLEQERYVELVTGSAERFVVVTRLVSATIPAQLPHINVFVLSVGDVADPKQDVLARVARISDLTTVPIGRDAGLAAVPSVGAEYLSATTTNSYDTLETANAAAVTFQDRVNALIESWITYNTQFSAPTPTPAIFTLPRVDDSQKEALIAAYKVAKQDRYQKQLLKTEADAALLRAQTDYTYKQNLVAGATTLVSGTTDAGSQLNTTTLWFDGLKTAGDTFRAANPGGTGGAAFDTALASAANQQTSMTTFEANAATLTATTTTYRNARQTESNTANTALTAAQSDQTTKAQQLVSAQATESAALTAVLAVCPDFDKNSIPFVDDTEP